MKKQVYHPRCRRPAPASQATVWGMMAFMGFASWGYTPPVYSQARPGETFELPEICATDLASVVPEPGEADPSLSLLSLTPEANPLALPTQPQAVTITEAQPLSLDQVVELAYRNSPTLETARLAVERNQAALEEARASLEPRVDLRAGVTAEMGAQGVGVNAGPSGEAEETEETEDSGAAEDSGDTEDSGENGLSTVAAVTGNLGAAYDLATGGERSARIEAAELQLRRQQLALEQAQEELRSQVNLAYYAAQSARERISISQAFLTESCRNLRDTILFYEAEVGTRFDVLRADLQVAQARQDLVLSRSAWETAQRRLTALLNLPADITVTPTRVSIRGVWPLTLEESIVLAFQNRAELESDLVQRDLAASQRQIALSTLRPRAQVSGSVNAALALNDVADAGIPGLDSNTSGGFGLRLGGSWRVFDGGAAIARAAQADRDQAIAESTFSLDRGQIRLAVEQAYFNLEANLANIDTARTALEQAREALRLARRRFDAGVGDQLDVLVAQRELTEAQVRLLESVLGYNRSLSALERAVSNLAENSN